MNETEHDEQFNPKTRRQARKAARTRRKADQWIVDLIDPLARKIGVSNYRKASTYTVRRDRVHIDHEVGGRWHDCSEFYARAWEAGLAALPEHDADRPGGMSLPSFVLWRMYRPGNDTSWWRAGTTMPKAVIYAYLATAELDNDTGARRIAWLDMGYEGWKFDQIHGIVNWTQPTIPGMADDWDGHESSDEDAPADGPNFVDPEFEGQLRLFETEDLTEVERRVWKLRRCGFDNPEVDDMIPAHLLPKDASPKWRAEKVSIIYSEAKRKAQTFFGYLDD